MLHTLCFFLIAPVCAPSHNQNTLLNELLADETEPPCKKLKRVKTLLRAQPTAVTESFGQHEKALLAKLANHITCASTQETPSSDTYTLELPKALVLEAKAYHQTTQSPQSSNLLKLPLEMLDHITRNLDVQSVYRLSATCRALRHACYTIGYMRTSSVSRPRGCRPVIPCLRHLHIDAHPAPLRFIQIKRIEHLSVTNVSARVLRTHMLPTPLRSVLLQDCPSIPHADAWPVTTERLTIRHTHALPSRPLSQPCNKLPPSLTHLTLEGSMTKTTNEDTLVRQTLKLKKLKYLNLSNTLLVGAWLNAARLAQSAQCLHTLILKMGPAENAHHVLPTLHYCEHLRHFELHAQQSYDISLFNTDLQRFLLLTHIKTCKFFIGTLKSTDHIQEGIYTIPKHIAALCIWQKACRHTAHLSRHSTCATCGAFDFKSVCHFTQHPLRHHFWLTGTTLYPLYNGGQTRTADPVLCVLNAHTYREVTEKKAYAQDMQIHMYHS